MDSLSTWEGSPLLPVRFIFFFFSASFVLSFFYWVYLKGRTPYRKKKKKQNSILSVILRVNLILSVFIAFVGFFYLFPVPKITNTSPENFTRDVSPLAKISVTFSKPVKRKDLIKEIYPYTPGDFVFEDPLYDTHLYRKLVFYPKFTLEGGKEYILKLSGVKNFLSFANKQAEIRFTTGYFKSVLGADTQRSDDGGLYISGTYPENGWIQVASDNPVKIAFNKAVDRRSAEAGFVIEPPIKGSFLWEDNVLVFNPESIMPYHKIFTVRVLSNVKALDGSVLKKDYLFYFASQEDIFRLKVPALLQKYSLSCEIASLRMALLYRGIDISEDELLQHVGFDNSVKKGETWGNPYVGFVGKVNGSQMVNGYGVFWDPIARAANKYRYARSFENWTITELTDSIQKGTPAIIWTAFKNGRPVEWKAPSGDLIKSVADEHAVVAVGFRGLKNDPTHIIVNDPLQGESYWDRQVFEKKWSAFKNSGVVVY